MKFVNPGVKASGFSSIYRQIHYRLLKTTKPNSRAMDFELSIMKIEEYIRIGSNPCLLQLKKPSPSSNSL